MPTMNLHEQKRIATRDALREAALRRFGEDGFDEVTVADIAADVGVSERTFYRHFPNKEAVLFQDYITRLDWFSKALELQPKGAPLLERVAAAVMLFPDNTEIVRQAALLRGEVMSRERVEESLRLIQALFAAEIRDVLVREMDDRPDGALIANVAGAAIAGALVAVVDTWGQLGAGTEDELQRLLATAMDFLRGGLQL